MRYPDLLVTARDRKRYQRYRAERGQFVHGCVDMLIAAWRVLDEKMATTTDPACATILMQIRNVLESLDGVAVLVREGCTQNCFHLLRSAWETYWGILWVLADDTERRAKAYQLAHAHRTVAFAERFDYSTKVNKALRERVAQQNHAHVFEEADVDSTAIADRMKLLFDSPEFRDIEAAWLEASAMRRNKAAPPAWYSLFKGPETTRQLAYAVGEGVAYETFYSFYSDAVHGTNAFDHMAAARDGDSQSVRPIRHPFWINKVSSQAGQIAVLLVSKALTKYAPDKAEWFKSQYVKQLRPMMLSLTGDEMLNAPWA
jgi:hypothetical protein